MQFDFKSSQVKRRGKTFVSTPTSSPTGISPRFSLPPWIHTRLVVSAMSFTLGFLCVGIALFHLLGFLSSWKKQTPYAFALITAHESGPVRKNITVIWIDPKKDEMRIITYPPQLEIITNAFGTYPVGSLPALFIQEKRSQKELAQVLSYATTIQLKGVIENSSAQRVNRSVLRASVLQSLYGGTKTSLPYADRIALTEYIVTSHHRVVEEAIPETVLIEKTEGLEKRAEFADPLYRSWLSKRVSHFDLAEDDMSIAVVNASGVRGVGAIASNILERMGFQVLSLGDTSDIRENGVLFLRQTSLTKTSTFIDLQALFPVQVSTDEEEALRKRADLVLYIGKKEAGLLPRK